MLIKETELNQIGYLNAIEFALRCLEQELPISPLMKNKEFIKEYFSMIKALKKIIKPITQDYTTAMKFIRINGYYLLNYYKKVQNEEDIKYELVIAYIASDFKSAYFITESDPENNKYDIKKFESNGFTSKMKSLYGYIAAEHLEIVNNRQEIEEEKLNLILSKIMYII